MGNSLRQARRALDRGAEVVFVDNRPKGVGGDGDLDQLLTDTLDLASDRAGRRIQSASEAVEKR